MRSSTVSVVVAAVLAAGPQAALAQSPEGVSQAAGELPPSLFEPAPDALPGRRAAEDGGGTSLLVAGVLLAGAAAVGYLTGSSRRTRRS